MSKYNLLDNKRTDDLDSMFEEQPPGDTTTPPRTDDKSEIKPSDNLNVPKSTEEPLEDSMFSVSPGKEAISEPAPAAIPDEPIGEQVKSPPVTDELDIEEAVTIQKTAKEDYEDEKQTKINYKPIVIGLVVVFVIIASYLVISNFFLGGESKPIPVREKTVKPEEKLKNERVSQKAAFSARLNAEKRHRIGFISALGKLKTKNISYSSILLYGQNLNFEIFSSGRDDIARFNMKIKNNPDYAASELVSVDQRPGQNGGLFALYDVTLEKVIPSGGKAAVADTPPITSPDNWIKQNAKSNKLNLRRSRQLSTKKENLFIAARMEYSFRGSEKNCLAFLNQLSASNLNANIYKLAMIPLDQQNFKNTRYKLDLTLDLYF